MILKSRGTLYIYSYPIIYRCSYYYLSKIFLFFSAFGIDIKNALFYTGLPKMLTSSLIKYYKISEKGKGLHSVINRLL
jgi:hypothetical protein